MPLGFLGAFFYLENIYFYAIVFEQNNNFPF